MSWLTDVSAMPVSTYGQMLDAQLDQLRIFDSRLTRSAWPGSKEKSRLSFGLLELSLS